MNGAHAKTHGGDRLVVASHNPGKVWEINQLIEPYGLDAISAGDLGLSEPEETEPTFEGNAKLKALVAAKGAKLPALADDSGIEVDLLGGAPGIYSARWAGPTKDFSIAMQRVHDELAKIGGWNGPYRAPTSYPCCVLPGLTVMPTFTRAEIDGQLVWPPRGGNGFGYDPMFLADDETLTFGEMEPKRKYAISHRTRAFAKFKRVCLEGGE